MTQGYPKNTPGLPQKYPRVTPKIPSSCSKGFRKIFCKGYTA
jgi:hypothetical protein